MCLCVLAAAFGPAAIAANSTVPRHVLTADYFGAPYGSTSVSAARAAAFLTWAQVSVREADATAAAGIRTQYYVDAALSIANRGDQLYTSDESTFAHDCTGSRIAIPYDGLTEYLMDLNAPSMRDVFRRWITRVTSAVHFDALWLDDADLPSEYLRFRAMPCGYDDGRWITAMDQFDRYSPVPVILSGLNASKRPQPSGIVALLSSDRTLGENYEHCYSSTNQQKVTGTVWQATENSELRVSAARKLFECMARNGAPASESIDARVYLYASFLLTYDPATSVIWEEYATPSRFRVEPESELVALSPLRAAPNDISGLQTSRGAYVREFARCYIAGTLAGACASVVNSGESPLPFPLRDYRRTLRLAGGGILDGGTISADGPPPPAQLAPAEGLIVFK